MGESLLRSTIACATPMQLMDLYGQGFNEAGDEMLARHKELIDACEAYLYGREDSRECESMMRVALARAKGSQ